MAHRAVPESQSDRDHEDQIDVRRVDLGGHRGSSNARKSAGPASQKCSQEFDRSREDSDVRLEADQPQNVLSPVHMPASTRSCACRRRRRGWQDRPEKSQASTGLPPLVVNTTQVTMAMSPLRDEEATAPQGSLVLRPDGEHRRHAGRVAAGRGNEGSPASTHNRVPTPRVPRKSTTSWPPISRPPWQGQYTRRDPDDPRPGVRGTVMTFGTIVVNDDGPDLHDTSPDFWPKVVQIAPGVLSLPWRSRIGGKDVVDFRGAVGVGIRS